MGEPAAALTPGVALDRFFEAYYRRRPVTATFTGVHAFDGMLPDWSPEGLTGAAAEMRAIRGDLAAAGLVADERVRAYPDEVDLALADGFLEIQFAEHDGRHFYRGNPSLWTGEAIFAVVSLVTRDFAPIEQRLESAVARLRDIPRFLGDALRTLQRTPDTWRDRALRECDAASMLFGRSLPGWAPRCGVSLRLATAFIEACHVAHGAFNDFAAWLRAALPSCPVVERQAGPELLNLLLRRGHWCRESIDGLLREAGTELAEETARLDAGARALSADGWPGVQAQLAARRPTREDYLPRFDRAWTRAREAAVAHDLVTWPDAPIRYVPIPEHTREAAPLLYYLFYRSPAAFDVQPVHDYVVTPVDEGLPGEEQARRLRAASDSTILLNHVIHHGGIGHHVQNWNAYRSASRIGQVAAIDAASRIAMFCGGSMAEGWACYVCDLMEEVGFLSPVERVSQQHTRVRILARAVVDLSFHTGRMTSDEAAAFFETHGMMPAAGAAGEALKCAMFPGTASMYWIGTRGIHALRHAVAARAGATFSRRRFHDRFLSYGAIPVGLIAQLMKH